MNKSTFASVTALVVATGAVAGAIYYRHKIVETLRDLDTMFKPNPEPAARRQINLLLDDMTEDELDQLDQALKADENTHG